MRWSVDSLDPRAVGVSASRRTDIPALFGEWFGRRLEQGFAEYVPLGPPRRVRRSLRPADVTHFNFWTKWPRPFVRTLARVLEAGYPVLFNVTITGLGGTAVEPRVPAPERVVAAVEQLSAMLPRGAIAWRYDPVFVSRRFDRAHHREVFRRLRDRLAPLVDRVIISFTTRYRRQVDPDLHRYEHEAGDRISQPELAEQVAIVADLKQMAAAASLQLTCCCAPDLSSSLLLPSAGCNSFDWARRIYADLRRLRPLRRRPSRPGCTCSEEVDIGVYDTCILGCRYSYGSCDLATAQRNFARHDPAAPCLIP